MQKATQEASILCQLQCHSLVGSESKAYLLVYTYKSLVERICTGIGYFNIKLCMCSTLVWLMEYDMCAFASVILGHFCEFERLKATQIIHTYAAVLM